MSLFSRLVKQAPQTDAPKASGAIAKLIQTHPVATFSPRYPRPDVNMSISNPELAKAIAAKKRSKPGAVSRNPARPLVGATGARNTFGLRPGNGGKARGA